MINRHIVQVQSSKVAVCFSLCPKKRDKWITQIRNALSTGQLDAGNAAKLAGKLNFATQYLFRRLGRAMIRALYAQTSSTTGKIGNRLREAFGWWLRILALNICESHPLNVNEDKKSHRLFVDAASTPAHCAAVLCHNDTMLYTNAEPEKGMLEQLIARRDKQITSLVFADSIHENCNASCPLTQEMLAIYLAITTFQKELAGQRVILYSDNKGMLYASHL